MENVFSLLSNPTNGEFLSLFLKAFAVLFAFLYLLLTVVMTRQTQIMNQTFTTTKSSLLLSISSLQIVLAGILIIISLFLI